MSKFDNMYLDLCEKILTQGIRTEARNGVTYRIPGNYWEFDLEEEFPILTVKKVGIRLPVTEMLFLYQSKTCEIQWLRDRDIHIWDKFEVDTDGVYRNPDTGEERFIGKQWAGTYGSSYNYILRNGGPNGTDQMNNCIFKITHHPEDRRNIINLWQQQYFPTAVLPPCVYESQWLVIDGKLHSFFTQRSCDMGLGVPFNITQFAALTCMLAQVTNLRPGTMHYHMVDTHIYEIHIDGIKEQLRRRKDAYPAPTLWLNPEIKNFYEFDNSKELKDIKLENYKDLGKVTLELLA